MSAPTATVPIVDIRTLGACEDRKARVLATFDALPPGASLEVVNDHRPMGLLRHFEALRSGQFRWTPTEDGPEVFRVRITREATDRDTPA